MRQLLLIALIAGLAAPPALADIPPYPRPGPRPSGPTSAVVRGLAVEQVAARGTAEGWAINITACADTQPGCRLVDLSRTSRWCSVTAVDGRRIAGGDVAALQNAVNSAGARPVRLTLNGCRSNEMTLNP